MCSLAVEALARKPGVIERVAGIVKLFTVGLFLCRLRHIFVPSLSTGFIYMVGEFLMLK